MVTAPLSDDPPTRVSSVCFFQRVSYPPPSSKAREKGSTVSRDKNELDIPLGLSGACSTRGIISEVGTALEILKIRPRAVFTFRFGTKVPLSLRNCELYTVKSERDEISEISQGTLHLVF